MKINRSISAKLARAIFRAGNFNGRTCTRIQFKSGTWPDNERDEGGMCERALKDTIAAEIDRLNRASAKGAQ